jgi:two-component system alkaline phosphatase synthesis response regulator PhoP
MMKSPLLVLIADDHPSILLPLAYVLRQIDKVEVMTAEQGHDAVELAMRHRPNLVILDVMMPGMDGYTVCRTIRRGWSTHRGQIWFLTARSSQMDLAQARQVGADRVITKPFSPDEVIRLVSELRDETSDAGAARNMSSPQYPGAPT